MDGFGDDFVSTPAPAPVVESDPAADFLAREQNDLAGLEDDIAPAVPVPVVSTEEPTLSEPVTGMVNGSADPAEFKRVADDEPIPLNRIEGASPIPPPVREEPEKIRLWREAQAERLQLKDEKEEKEKNELREGAKSELEEWYKQHEEQVTKTRQANRSAEKELVADNSRIEPGTEWERIAKLCDFNPKTAKASRDISRMRSIILQVKQNPPVKG